ncbi:MAG: hypothetical protein Q3979_08110 [Actinomycetaceae bacterium]|nr:hypothetical protein [Actinomycetaceae bacterium]
MTGPYVSVAVEGGSDTAAVEALMEHVGLALAKSPVVKRGVGNLDKLIGSVAHAPRSNPWIVFRDSDRECPVDLRRTLLKGADDNPFFQLRLARPMTEAWLLADAQGFSDFFGVAASSLPPDPDSLDHAKRKLLTLCQGSRFRNVRREVCRDGGRPGPLYVDWLNRFARERRDIKAAAAVSESLARAVNRLSDMRERLTFD